MIPVPSITGVADTDPLIYECLKRISTLGVPSYTRLIATPPLTGGGALSGNVTIGLGNSGDVGTLLIRSANSLEIRRANAYATGKGTSTSPWTSASGTGGLQEAYNALPANGGAVYMPSGYYAITVPLNGTANTNSIITGASSPVKPTIFFGDGSANTILVGSTRGQGGWGSTIGPVFDMTGTSHNQFRDFAIIQGAANKSTVGILLARSSTGDSQYTQNNCVENVYMSLVHDATANNGNGTIGIYSRSSETSLFVNDEILCDIPYVFTGQDVYSIASPNQSAGTINSCAQNGIIGGYAAGYYAAVVFQGGAHNNFVNNLTLGQLSGATGTHAIKVLADTSTGANNIYGMNVLGLQIEGWNGVLSTTAPIHKMRLDCSYSQDASGSNPGILLSGTNAKLVRCEINASNTNAGSVQKLIGDGGATTAGVKGCVVHLGTPLTINAPYTPALGNTIHSDSTGTPSITWSAPDPGQLVVVTAQQPLVGAMAGPVGHTVYVSTADKTVANTTNETTLIGTGVGSLTFPANFFTVGKTIRLSASGFGGINGGGTVRFRVKFGSVEMTGSTALTPTAFVANRNWRMDCEITCRTTGGSGTFSSYGAGFLYYIASGSLLGMEFAATSDIVASTTATETLDFTVEFGTASSSNTLTCKNFIVEVIGITA